MGFLPIQCDPLQRRMSTMSIISNCRFLGLIYAVLCFYSNVSPSAGQEISASISDSTVLRTDVIEANDHRFRPINNQSAAIVVTVEFHLLQLLHIDELEMKMKTSCAFHFTWMDEIRVWAQRNYSGIRVIHPDPTDVWRPRIFIINSLGDRDVFKDNYAHLSVLWTGKTQWNPGINLVTSCDLNLRFYPFDEQVCYIFAQTSAFSHEVELTSSNTSAILGQFTENGEWTLLDTKIEIFDSGYELESFSEMKISVFLKRDPKFFLINLLLPTLMLSLLSLMVFVLPRGSGERAGYCMTVLLSLSLIQITVSDNLPQTPQTFPFIVMYLFALYILSWMMMISTIIVLVWHNKSESQGQGQENCGDYGDSYDPKMRTRMEGSFVPLDAGFTEVSDHDRESLKAYYAPLGPDYSSSQASNDKAGGGGVRPRTFVFLRDFRKVHPEEPKRQESSSASAENATEDKSGCFHFIYWKLASFGRFLTSDVDVILFCIFLTLWSVVSIVFLLTIKLG